MKKSNRQEYWVICLTNQASTSEFYMRREILPTCGSQSPEGGLYCKHPRHDRDFNPTSLLFQIIPPALETCLNLSFLPVLQIPLIWRSRGSCRVSEDSDLLWLGRGASLCDPCMNMADVRSRQSGSSFGSSPSLNAQDEPNKEKTSLFGFVKKTWQKTGLDRPTILLMMKWVYDQASTQCSTVGDS